MFSKLYSLAPTMVDIENTEQPETTDRQKYNEMKQEELKTAAEKSQERTILQFFLKNKRE